MNKNESKYRNNTVSNSVRAGTGVALFTFPFFLIPAANAEYDVVAESVKGLEEYIVYKHDGTGLSSGDLIAPNLRETELGMTIVTEEQLAGKDPVDVARAIQKNTTDVDTVVLIVDGETDTFHVGSSDRELESAVQNALGTEPVEDAGFVLLNNADPILVSYAEAGGAVTESFKSELMERVENSPIVQSSVSGLAKDNVFVHNGAGLSNESTLENSFESGKIDVVVIPEKDANFSASQIGDSILNEHDVNALIVVVDGKDSDQIVVSSHNSELQEEMTGVLGSGDVSDAGEILATSSTEMVGIEDSYMDATDKFMAAGSAMGVIMATALTITGVVWGVKSIKNKVKERKAREMTYSKMIQQRYSTIDEGFKNAMVSLEDISVAHKGLNSNASLNGEIKELSRRIHDLLDVLEDNRISDGKRRELEIGYANRLGKLNELLSDKYYLDLVENPDYWDNSDERVKQVQSVLKGMTENIVENIRRVNKDHDIDVRVALAALEGLNHNSFEEAFTQSNNVAKDDVKVEGRTNSDGTVKRGLGIFKKYAQ